MSLIVIGYVYLVGIDLFRITLNLVERNILGLILPINILLSIILVITGLLKWYYVTIKYYWFEIKKMKNSFQRINRG
ncbi:MAG: hypothetical protein ACFFFY_03525 [Promethearchaeota archaeon]